MGKRKRQVRIPRQPRGVRTRERIVKAAERLFSDKGFHGTNSKEIAAAAKVSVGSFYGYFEDKKALFIEVLKRYNQRVAEKAFDPRQFDLQAAGQGQDIIFFFLKKALAAHDLSPQFHREATAMRYSDSEIKEIHDQADEFIQEFLVALLSKLGEKVRVQDLEAAAVVVSSAVEEVVHSIKIFGSRLQENRLMRELADMISRYLFA